MTYEQKLKNLKRIADATRKVKSEQAKARAQRYQFLRLKHGL